MSTGTIAPLTFTGISQFSNDFQTILNRAVSIASIPLQQLQNQQTDILQKKTLAGNLSAAVSDLADAVTTLGQIGKSQALNGTSSDSTKIQFNSTTADAPTSYRISVTSLAKAAGETSSSFASTTTAVSSTGRVKLIAGGTTHILTLSPDQNNLTGLRDAINAVGAGVTASVLTGGTTNYLSVTANAMGQMDLELVDDPAPAAAQTLGTVTNGAASSTASYADATSAQVSLGGNMRLVVAGQSYSISLGSGQNNLNGLASAINNAKAGVTAAVITNSDGTSGLKVTAADSSVTDLQLVDDPAPANVQEMGTVADGLATSTATWADPAATPVSLAGAMRLVVGTSNYNITLASGKNNLNGLVDAINAAGAGVTASAVNGQLQLQGDASLTNLQLIDDPAPAAQALMGAVSSGVSTSTTGYADAAATPVSLDGTLRLQVGTSSFAIALNSKNNNLNGLVTAINNAGAGVTASVVNDGTTNHLKLTAKDSSTTVLQLTDDPAPAPAAMLSNTNQGSNASFTVNGALFTPATNTINNIVPGVSFTLKSVTNASGTDSPVTLTLSSDPSQISTALQTFVTKYNALKQLTNAQTGTNAGLLSGDSMVLTIKDAMSSLTNYNGGSGLIKSLGALGIEIDKNGTMSFKSDTFGALSSKAISDAFSFLGSDTSGFGQLADNLTAISDPITGLIKVQTDQYDATDTRLTDQISDLTARINAMQTAMSTKLQAADALVAQLASQQSLLTASIQSLNFTSYGYNNQNTSSQSQG